MLLYFLKIEMIFLLAINSLYQYRQRTKNKVFDIKQCALLKQTSLSITSLNRGPPCPKSAAIVMSSRIGRVQFVWMMLVPNTRSMRPVVLSVLTALICKLWRRADTGSIWSVWRATPSWEQMVAPLGLCRARIAGMRCSRITETTQQCLNGGHRAFAA